MEVPSLAEHGLCAVTNVLNVGVGLCRHPVQWGTCLAHLCSSVPTPAQSWELLAFLGALPSKARGRFLGISLLEWWKVVAAQIETQCSLTNP